MAIVNSPAGSFFAFPPPTINAKLSSYFDITQFTNIL